MSSETFPDNVIEELESEVERLNAELNAAADFANRQVAAISDLNDRIEVLKINVLACNAVINDQAQLIAELQTSVE